MNTPKTTKAQKEKQPALPPNRVRGLLAFRGESISSWARARGYHPQHVCMSIRGLRAGPRALEITRRMRQELGL